MVADHTTTAATPDGVPNLAAKLNRLFDAVRREDGTKYSNDAAAQALEGLGVHVTGQNLWYLRTGKRTNPSFVLLDGLAKLFGVPVGYFSDEATEAKVSAELDMLATLRDAGVSALMTRAIGISPQNLEHLSGILDQIRHLEGLDAVANPPTADQQTD